jgi:hypothetical protein
LLLIYRKYYGARMAARLAVIFYITMVLAGYVVEILFDLVHLTPQGARRASVGMNGPTWNYTSWLNIAFLLLAVVLLARFFATGGRAMLAMMGGGPDDMTHHDHDHGHGHGHSELHRSPPEAGAVTRRWGLNL